MLSVRNNSSSSSGSSTSSNDNTNNNNSETTTPTSTTTINNENQTNNNTRVNSNTQNVDSNRSNNSSTNTNTQNNNNNLNDIMYQLKRIMIERNANSFVLSTFLMFMVVVGLVNLTSHSLLWMCALIAALVTIFQIWYGLRQNRYLHNGGGRGAMYLNNGGYIYQHTWGGVNRYPGHNGSFTRFPHLMNAPLNLQLTLIDRDFNSNDYEMLLALDSDNQNYGGAKKEQIDLLPTHCIQSEKDLENLFNNSSCFGSSKNNNNNSNSDENNNNTEDIDTTDSDNITSKSNSTSQYKDSTISACSICLENFNIDDLLRTLPCLHHFHVGCVDRWLKIKSTCPICKSDFRNYTNSPPSSPSTSSASNIMNHS